jgi:hypothetical protein
MMTSWKPDKRLRKAMGAAKAAPINFPVATFRSSPLQFLDIFAQPALLPDWSKNTTPVQDLKRIINMPDLPSSNSPQKSRMEMLQTIFADAIRSSDIPMLTNVMNAAGRKERQSLPDWARKPSPVNIDAIFDRLNARPRRNFLIPVELLPSPSAIEIVLKTAELLGENFRQPDSRYRLMDSFPTRLMSNSRLGQLQSSIRTAFGLSNAVSVLGDFYFDEVPYVQSRLEELCHAYARHPRTGRFLVSDRPLEMHFDNVDRLHCETGPAILYRDNSAVYAWHGIVIPPGLIMRPISLKQIVTEQNIEIKRVMIERYGPDKFIQEVGKPIAQDEFGKLWQVEIIDSEFERAVSPRFQTHMVMVEVKNSTPEPDGSIKTYFLRVPPSMRTPREAIAWTFRMRADDYDPEQQT